MTPIVIPAETVRRAEQHAVYLRQRWTDDWTAEPNLFCNWFNFTASPTISSAEFEWRYGEGLRQADEAFGQVERLDRLGWWAKVELVPAAVELEHNPDGTWTASHIGEEITGTREECFAWLRTEGLLIVWVGMIAEDGDSPEGALNFSPAGVQKLLAYGPEFLLERQTIATSYFLDGSDEKRIHRGLTFNDTNRVRPSGGVDKRSGDDRPGNRSAVRGGGNTYLFAGDPATAAGWSSLDIADYLLGYQVPRDEDYEQIVPIFLDADTSLDYLPSWDRPAIDQHGRTLREALNELMDRRRMLGYELRYELVEEVEMFRLYVFSFADEEIVLEEGKKFAANADQVSLDFDAAVEAADCHLKESATNQYDQVIASGARIVCCGTIAGRDLTLAKHWTDDQAQAYNAAASGADDYADLEQFDKDDRNKAVRASEELRRVFSYFGLPDDWDGTVGDGENAEGIVPLLDESLVDFAAADVAWYPGELRFLDRLPLKTDHDYSGSKIADDLVADNTPPGRSWHYRDVFALLKLPPGPDGTPRSGGTRYAEVTRLADGCLAEIYGDGAGTDFSCSVRPQPDGPGVIIRVHGGVGQHEIAGDDFVSLDEDTDPPGTFDWRDNLIVTFAMEADIHVEALYPAELPDGLDAAKILRIDASRSATNPEAVAGLHYVAPGTVVGLDDGKLVRTTSGGLVRDDRPLLERIARAAYEWYGRRRQALTIAYRRVCGEFRVGQLIAEIGSGETAEPVRSVVTEVRYDLARGENETHRTTIQTQWAELDVLRLL